MFVLSTKPADATQTPEKFGLFKTERQAEKYREYLRGEFVTLYYDAEFEISEADAELIEIAKANADRPYRTSARDRPRKGRPS